MARIARLVVPGLPHHVTQRGNPRGQVFFEAADYALYLDMLAESAERARCAIWAYCLMPSHALSFWFRPRQMACAGPLPICIAAMRATSMPGRGPRDI
ncbi:MAG: hypothetical protein P1V13_19015 [Rhizobiaceae bacterium]|nr:hypothetical protein [Rhizobiaceae bacterium]